MDVTSLVVVCTLLGQGPDPFARPMGSGASSPSAGYGSAATLSPPPTTNATTGSRYGDVPTSAPPAARADYAAPGYGGAATTSSPGAVLPVAGAERAATMRQPPSNALPSAPVVGDRYSAGPGTSPSSSPAAAASNPIPPNVNPAAPAAIAQPRGFSSATPTAPPAALPSAATAQPRTAEQTAPNTTTPVAATEEDRSPAGELVREALAPPKSLNLKGKPITLLEALGRSSDRRRQSTIVYAYWKLAADVAEYHFAYQHEQFLRSLGELAAQLEQGPDAQHARTAVASRSAEAAAELREAELRLSAGQAELAAAAALATGDEGPLPRDLPHVGVYNTSFERVYARRVPPARAYLLQKSLPLRHDVVAVRAQTVLASQDAFEAALDAYRNRRLPLDDVLPTIAELRDRRAQFIVAVRRYNDEIAEYALSSAPEGTSRETLCGMLIKNAYTPKLGKAVVAEDAALFAAADGFAPADEGYSVVPTTFESATPVPDSVSAEPLPAAFEPTLAPPPTTGPAIPANAVPTNAIPANTLPTNTLPTNPSARTSQSEAATVSYWEALPKDLPPNQGRFAQPNLFDTADAQPLLAPDSAPATYERGTPTLAPPRERSAAPLKFKVNRMPLVEPGQLPQSDDAQPLPTNSAGRSPYSSATIDAPKLISAQPQTVSEPAQPFPTKDDSPQVLLGRGESSEAGVVGRIAVDEEVEPAGFYTTVAGLPPARRAQELVEQLHRAAAQTVAAAQASSEAKPISLDDCLAQSIAVDRREAIAAYWATAEAAASVHARSQQVAQLDALSEATFRFRESPVGAVAMLEVRAAKLAAESLRREALADLTLARWQLTDSLRKPLAETWLTTGTLPHAGGYQTKIDAVSADGGTRTKLTKLAATIEARHAVIQLRAEAVAGADQSAEQALQKYAAGRCYVHIPLAEFRRQTTLTDQLLANVTRYNRDIADYALTLLPNTTPPDTVASALVVNRQ